MAPPPRVSALQKKGAPAFLSSSQNPRLRTRKPASTPGIGIDVNLSAHPRTDPSSALNVLLKLLTSLPSRIGGCQYKLTAAEHALSLHLISIIDPFVYHGVRALAPNPLHKDAPGAPLTGLIDQPTEILDAILFHVDSKKDLLHVGLANKRLHGVVFPRHFEYRIIRCKVSSISVWNHLILHKSLARNVRKLEIIDERASGASSSSGGSSQLSRKMLVPSGILEGETDLESTDDELRMHSKQERYLASALLRMTGLKDFKWSCNHSPISIAHVWPTLMMRATSLTSIEICDNLVFAPKLIGAWEGDGASDESESEDSESESEGGVRKDVKVAGAGLMTRMPRSSLVNMTNVVFRTTTHSYGAAKQPELNRISAMLHQCTKLKNLDITYIPPRSAGSAQGSISRSRPLADEFLMYSRWSNTLTSLTLTNLRCASTIAPATFLAAHPTLEVLHLDVIVHTGGGFSVAGCLPNGSLPRLREIKASKEFVNAILECPCDVVRPLEVIKGFKLSGHNLAGSSSASNSSRTVPDTVFLSNLSNAAKSVRKVELTGWHDMEDIRKLTTSMPNVQHLDIGRRLGAVAQRNAASASSSTLAIGNGGSSGPAANIIEWTELLSTLPELTTLHGVKFFYEVSSAPTATSYSPSMSDSSSVSGPSGGTPSLMSSGAPGANIRHHAPSSAIPVQMSMMERSRMRKNDEIAGVLAWKCKKLRWVDHWEETTGKIIYLGRDTHRLHGEEGGVGKDKVRWEVRRVKV